VASIVAAAALYFSLTAPVRIDVPNIEFKARVVSNDLPNSVVFDYSVGNTDIDSVTIQQSWDPRRREKVGASNHQHTSLYYYPGVFQAKLLVDDQVVKEKEVYVQTQGWKGIISLTPIPAYLSAADIGLDHNTMEIAAPTLSGKTGKTVFNDVWTEFYDVHPFDNVDGENFVLQATLQNTSSKEQAVCQNTKVTVLGSSGVIVIPLCGKGCTSAISAYIAGTPLSGKENDLSAFGCDFSKPQALKMEVLNGRLKIYLNNLDIFSFPDAIRMGKIKAS
jgi:hypothetical protein